MFVFVGNMGSFGFPFLFFSFYVTFSDVDSWIHTIIKVVIGPWDTADVRLEDLSAASDGAPVTFVRRKRL